MNFICISCHYNSTDKKMGGKEETQNNTLPSKENGSPPGVCRSLQGWQRLVSHTDNYFEDSWSISS